MNDLRQCDVEMLPVRDWVLQAPHIVGDDGAIAFFKKKLNLLVMGDI